MKMIRHRGDCGQEDTESEMVESVDRRVALSRHRRREGS